MSYVPTPEDFALLGLSLELPADPANPHPAWVAGTRKYSSRDAEGNRTVIEVSPQYDNLLWIYRTSAHQQSTSTNFRGVCVDETMFRYLIGAIK